MPNMHINYLPTELLENILSFLCPEVQDVDWNPELWDRPSQLLNTRLVCRVWNRLMIKDAFHTINLVPSFKGLNSWTEMLDSRMVTSVARRVAICSTSEHQFATWNDFSTWKSCQLPAISHAMSRLGDISRLGEIWVRFSSNCEGPCYDEHGNVLIQSEFYMSESVLYREQTLKAIFKATKFCSSQSSNQGIRSLRLENLQNVRLTDFTSSELFKSVTKDINQLHLQVAVERHEQCPEHDAFTIERREFEPYMHRHWLTPLAHQLTTLTLYFRENWGTIPGIFDGKGLVFPHLKTLNLGAYTISHHDHLDWVLAQPSLKSLRLDYCHIVSYIAFYRHSIALWNLPTHDWQRLVGRGSFDINDGALVAYYYPGTWELFFNKIRNKLPRLTDFQFHVEKHPTISNNFNYEGSLSSALSPKRYIAFDVGCPRPWEEADDHGCLSFENYFPNIKHVVSLLNRPSEFGKEDGDATPTERELNRHEVTEAGDQRALDALLNETWRRRR